MKQEKKKIVKINAERGRQFKFTNEEGETVCFLNSNFIKGLNFEIERMDEPKSKLYYVSIYQFDEKENFNNYIGLLCNIQKVFIDNPHWTNANDMDEEIKINL